MLLQGRKLSPQMQGDDITLLHRELRQLGFVVSDEEAGQQLFGGTTDQAVRAFQTEYGLQSTGVVDEPTATRINAAVDALRPQPTGDAGGHPVVGQLLAQGTKAPLVGFTVRAFELDDGAQTAGIGGDATNEQGLFALIYPVPPAPPLPG